jgi:hypothetical protein
MNDLKDLTYEEQQKLLDQIQNLPGEPSNSIDMFVQSFDVHAKNWSVALKEFETIYSDSKK